MAILNVMPPRRYWRHDGRRHGESRIVSRHLIDINVRMRAELRCEWRFYEIPVR